MFRFIGKKSESITLLLKKYIAHFFLLPIFYAQKENKYINNITSTNNLIIYIYIVYLFYTDTVYDFDPSESE